MNAIRFPTNCPVCGGTIRTAPDAVANHAACHRTAYRMAEHANAMRQLAKVWPSRDVVVPDQPRQRSLSFAGG